MFRGNDLRTLREQRGFTKCAMSERSGVSLSTLSRLESGRSVPNIETLVKLANAIEIPLTKFLFKIGIVRK